MIFFPYFELSIGQVKAAKNEGSTITIKLYPLDIVALLYSGLINFKELNIFLII